MTELSAVSLFSGLGGLDLGFEAAGFRTLACCELNDQARVSLRANRADRWPVSEHTDARVFAREIRPRDLGIARGELDALIAAPPCQPFSTAGQWTARGRGGTDDDRGLLLFAVFDAAASLSPRTIVLENVPGFVRGATSVLPTLELALPELRRVTGRDYVLHHRILDAHAFGVPQARRRAIVVLTDAAEFPWPAATPIADRPAAWDAIGELDIDEGESLSVGGRWAGLLPSIPEGENYQWHTARRGGEPLFGFRTKFWSFLLKLAKARPSWTLAARPGPATGPFHWDSRRLAIQEMLRLQSFPADWDVAGDRRQSVLQIGNATPPALAERIALAVREVSGARAPSPSRTLAIARSGEYPPPERPRRVPRRYLALRADHEPHPGTGLGPAPVVRSSSDVERELIAWRPAKDASARIGEVEK